MKKTIAFFLALFLSISLCSCGTDQSGQKPGQTEEAIILSNENWHEYLHIETETQNFSYESTSSYYALTYNKGTADCVINISKSVPCSFSNAVIKLEVYSTSYLWSKYTRTIDIHVSADGYATKRETFTSEETIVTPDEPNFSYRIISISGTVQLAP